LVFTWHFLHWYNGVPIPFQGAPAIFPLAIFDEGHVGVALFMTLSGYLFAKLLAGKEILYGRFFWNRFIRLAPLLVFVMLVYPFFRWLEFHVFSFKSYEWDLLDGFYSWSWPNGGWSIAVEIQFYLLLPIIMFLTRRWPLAPVMFLASAIAFRAVLFSRLGSVQDLAYFTIIGRIDQFLLGIMAFQSRDAMRGRHCLSAVIVVAFLAFYWWFDRAGGYMAFGGKYPSPRALWIVLPTIEGAVFAWMTAYYDASFKPSNSGASWLLGKVGTYSYSIYLLHDFIVWRLPLIIGHRLFALSNFYVALAASIICFCGMAVIGWASYTFIEKPFLRLRVRYVRPATSTYGEMAPAPG
jgi:peptidoglycan/LPS O-acetylase OafA/YrhL